MSTVHVGDVLVGKYRVERSLGEGGMGYLVEATHLLLEQRVAIKLLHPNLTSQPTMVSRFAREARAMTRLRSDHVARVIDVGVLPDGTPFLVMELLEGIDLGALVRQRGPLVVELAVDFLLQACEAIAEAHALGIIHRDLKPANLFLTRGHDGSGCVKVLDFGISKLSASFSPMSLALTGTQAALGSPVYMSPEQLASARDVDARSDIWSLGAILFEFLVGFAPFDGESMPQLCHQILYAPAPSVRQRRPDVPAELEAVVHRCLEKEPRARFGNIAELAAAAAPYGSPAARVHEQRIRSIREFSSRPGDTPATLHVVVAQPHQGPSLGDVSAGHVAPRPGTGARSHPSGASPHDESAPRAFGGTARGARRGRSALLLWGVLLALVLACGFVYFGARALRKPGAAAASGSPSPTLPTEAAGRPLPSGPSIGAREPGAEPAALAGSTAQAVSPGSPGAQAAVPASERRAESNRPAPRRTDVPASPAAPSAPMPPPASKPPADLFDSRK